MLPFVIIVASNVEKATYPVLNIWRYLWVMHWRDISPISGMVARGTVTKAILARRRYTELRVLTIYRGMFLGRRYKTHLYTYSLLHHYYRSAAQHCISDESWCAYNGKSASAADDCVTVLTPALICPEDDWYSSRDRGGGSVLYTAACCWSVGGSS